MKRVYKSIISGLLIMIMLVGCNDKYDVKLEKVDDTLYFMSDNYDCNIVKNGWYEGIEIPFVTKKKIDKNKIDIKVDTETDVKYEYIISDAVEEELAYDTYLLYKNMDWNKLSDLKNDATKEIEYSSYYNSHKEDFENFKEKLTVYKYILTVNFKMDKLFLDEQIKEIKVKYGDENYTCKLDNVWLRTKYSSELNISEDNSFYFKTAASAGLNCTPNKDGNLFMREFEFGIDKDVIIKNISIVQNDTVKVDKVVINDMTLNTNATFSKDMKLLANTDGNMEIYLKDERFKSKLSYYAIATIDCEYEVKGQIHHVYIPVQYNCFLNAYEIYACKADKKDVLTYYTEYGYDEYIDNWQ